MLREESINSAKIKINKQLVIFRQLKKIMQALCLWFWEDFTKIQQKLTKLKKIRATYNLVYKVLIEFRVWLSTEKK